MDYIYSTDIKIGPEEIQLKPDYSGHDLSRPSRDGGEPNSRYFVIRLCLNVNILNETCFK
jgi:hypothetical protein